MAALAKDSAVSRVSCPRSLGMVPIDPATDSVRSDVKAAREGSPPVMPLRATALTAPPAVHVTPAQPPAHGSEPVHEAGAEFPREDLIEVRAAAWAGGVEEEVHALPTSVLATDVPAGSAAGRLPQRYALPFRARVLSEVMLASDAGTVPPKEL